VCQLASIACVGGDPSLLPIEQFFRSLVRDSISNLNSSIRGDRSLSGNDINVLVNIRPDRRKDLDRLAPGNAVAYDSRLRIGAERLDLRVGGHELLGNPAVVLAASQHDFRGQ